MLPADVPDINDRAVREKYQPVGVRQPLKEDIDFPAVVLRHVDGKEPAGMVLILDARNGKDTWSIPQDPIIFIVLRNLAGQPTSAYLDEGFERTGKASGTFTRAEPGQVKDLIERLLRAYEKVRADPTAGPLQPA